MAKLEKKVEEEKQKLKELKDSAIDAEKLYTSKCQNCHGATGEKVHIIVLDLSKDLSYRRYARINKRLSKWK